MIKKLNRNLIILTSTLPRWKDDETPQFILDHALLLAPYFREVVIIAPHSRGAKRYEEVQKNVVIKRIRYFIPTSQQNIFYSGGATEHVSLSPLYLLKLALYLMSLFYNVIKLRPGKDTVINANWVIPQGFVAVLVKTFYRKVPIITTARGTDIFTLNSKLVTKIKELVLKQSDKVIVNSHLLKTACSKIYKRDYTVQPTGYDNTVFKRSNKRSKQQHKTLQLISVGRLVEVKGFYDILSAVKILKKGNIDVYLKIVGSGPEENGMREYVVKNGLSHMVEFTGWLSAKRLSSLYLEADLYVGASKRAASGSVESFGNVYLEAMACGTPIIVSTLAGAAEIITHGENGFIIQPEMPSEIAEIIRALCLNRPMLTEMGERAANTAQQYSKKAARDKYLEIINEL